MVSRRLPSVFVDIAENGFAAGIKCGSLQPDVLTLDLPMPDLYGFEVCEMIRARFGKEKPRIVALAGSPKPGTSRRIPTAGADCCLGMLTPLETLLLERRLTVGSPVARPGR